jgi:FkbH-like protein
VGPKVDFLKSLKMVMTIKEADLEDLKRVEELTVRTHQLNTTGYTYSYDELCNFITSSEYKLYVAGLDDCYGTYGKIGLFLIKCDSNRWTIKLLLMSCRVMSRGVANVFINFVVESARAANKPLYAEFIHNENDRNRMMYITYKFAGFSTVEEMKEQNFELLEYDFSKSVSRPDYVEVITNEMFSKGVN